MSHQSNQLESYRKALLNRVTASSGFLEYVENCLTKSDEAAKYSFHKIMVHNWSGTDIQLFETLTEYFKATMVPIMYTSQGDITSFYTNSLTMIMKMMKLDFMFPFQRNMFNIDILFNDKNSKDCFDTMVSIEDIVSGVVSRRFGTFGKCELDLSNFCCDPEFVDKKINFYKISLLSHFKIMMIRIGNGTKSLDLSNNNLSNVPTDILNFFTGGKAKEGLTEVNLSNNNIPSLTNLRVSSIIEKLWLEGNPLCDEMEPSQYIKNVLIKFPRLIELDGVKLNQHGLVLPPIKNYLVTPDRRTKMVTEKFLTLYFSHYDIHRDKVATFYDANATLTILSGLPVDLLNKPQYQNMVIKKNVTVKSGNIMPILNHFPKSIHDPYSFQVDVLMHDKKAMFLVVDGIYKELSTSDKTPDKFFQFRRTFFFNINTKLANSLYTIVNEMFSVMPATQEQIDNSFKHPIRNANELTLINPDIEESAAICSAFMHVTQLKKSEAEARLRICDWDIRKALLKLITNMRDDKISSDKFIEEDDFSDTDSLMDEID